MILRHTIATLAIACLLSLACVHLSVRAHKGAEGVVKDRMAVMKSMGEASKTLAAMFKGETAYSKDKVRELSALIRKHASEMTELFPKGSDRHPSEAKATIWTDWKGFVAASERLWETTLHLQDAANNEPAALTAFIRVGKSCKGCHRDYRVKGE